MRPGRVAVEGDGRQAGPIHPQRSGSRSRIRDLVGAVGRGIRVDPRLVEGFQYLSCVYKCHGWTLAGPLVGSAVVSSRPCVATRRSHGVHPLPPVSRGVPPCTRIYQRSDMKLSRTGVHPRLEKAPCLWCVNIFARLDSAGLLGRVSRRFIATMCCNSALRAGVFTHSPREQKILSCILSTNPDIELFHPQNPRWRREKEREEREREMKGRREKASRVAWWMARVSCDLAEGRAAGRRRRQAGPIHPQRSGSRSRIRDLVGGSREGQSIRERRRER
ncbi:hypothetical protein BSL78_10268 [Apostichopus japonicus]|uniref:Uncharacterized protein n=1 Tax=Stichopus japonicus TaxID=307972 RepID=A0A2G8KXZ7_STIJA|nr:hypothetical protein BSL78_10268 [Apostichopus japonicus]